MGAGARSWSGAFRRSAVAPSLFKVSPRFEPAVESWLSEGRLPSMARGEVRSWAFGDGGVTACDGSSFGSMPSGMWVAGWRSLRHLVDALGLAPPRRSIRGEDAHLRGSPTVPSHSGEDQAKLLTAYYDGQTMRWAIRRLLGDEGLASTRDETAPAPAAWGDAGFCEGARKALADSMAVGEATAYARRLDLQLLEDTPLDEPYRGIVGVFAQQVADLHRVGLPTIEEWLAAGVSTAGALAALEGGMTAEEGRGWVELGAPTSPFYMSFFAASARTPADAAPYVALGVDANLACRLAMKDVPIGEIARSVREGADPMAVARVHVFGAPSAASPG